MTRSLGEVTVGMQLPTQIFQLERADLIRYAGASGDFNPIHWSRETAQSVGLPDVIAHGMLTMATAARVVTDWLQDPGAVLSYSVKFTRPVVVTADNPASIEVSGVITAIDVGGSDAVSAAVAVIELKAYAEGKTVLGKARATVRLAP